MRKTKRRRLEPAIEAARIAGSPPLPSAQATPLTSPSAVSGASLDSFDDAVLRPCVAQPNAIAASPHAPQPPNRPSPQTPSLAMAASPLNALAQLRLSQGPTIDQWRDASVAGIDAALSLDALADVLADAEQRLVALPDRPAWRSRRLDTLTTLVDAATRRMVPLATEARDIRGLARIADALTALAPSEMAAQHATFVLAVAHVGDAVLSASGADLVALEHAWTACEQLMPALSVDFDDAEDRRLRDSLVASLWYRLLEAPLPLSTASIAAWTSRSQAMCRKRPSPQIAALVWLRALIDEPHMGVVDCVHFTHALRLAWTAAPNTHNITEATGEAAVQTPDHLPQALAFEPAARTQLTVWVAVLTNQLPPLAPFQAAPIREAFAQLAQALQFHIDIEIDAPCTEGDAEMQAREAAQEIAEWEATHNRPFPGYDDFFPPPPDGLQRRLPALGHFLTRADGFYSAAGPRPPSPPQGGWRRFLSAVDAVDEEAADFSASRSWAAQNSAPTPDTAPRVPRPTETPSPYTDADSTYSPYSASDITSEYWSD